MQTNELPKNELRVTIARVTLAIPGIVDILLGFGCGLCVFCNGAFARAIRRAESNEGDRK
ncbi:MAG: hypothetical protein NXI24_22215 [bacterium]|nr:hypothetical protein [bacterium]